MYCRTNALGQVEPIMEPTQPTPPPEWVQYARAGYDILTGKATIEEPKIEVVAPKTTAQDWLKNPLLWIGAAGLVLAWTRR